MSPRHRRAPEAESPEEEPTRWGAALLDAGRRFLTVLVGISLATTAISLVIGLLAGTSVSRAISLGFYVVGSCVLLIGFVIGNRGPVRLREEVVEHVGGDTGVRTRRLPQWASIEERSQGINNSAVFITVGFCLLALGVATDTRYPLF
jgi:hypothetical protein